MLQEILQPKSHVLRGNDATREICLNYVGQIGQRVLDLLRPKGILIRGERRSHPPRKWVVSNEMVRHILIRFKASRGQGRVL